MYIKAKEVPPDVSIRRNRGISVYKGDMGMSAFGGPRSATAATRIGGT